MGRVAAESALQTVALTVVIVAVIGEPGRHRLALAGHFHTQQLAVASALAFHRLLAYQHFELVALLQILGEIHPPLEQVGNFLDMVGWNPRIAGTDIEAAVDHAVVTLRLPLNLLIDHGGGIGIVAARHHQRLLDVQADFELLQDVVLIDQQLDILARFEARQIVLVVRVQHLVEGGGGETEIVKNGGQVFAVADPVILPLGGGVNRDVVIRRTLINQFVIGDFVKVGVVFVGCRTCGINGQLKTQRPLEDVTRSWQ